MRKRQGPLSGIGVLITRPARQSATFAGRLATMGGIPFILPGLIIAPPENEAPVAQALERLNSFDFALFVSANAAEAVLARHPAWPPNLIAIAVGPSTADALISGGITNVIAPAERYDSEGVLSLPALQQVAGKRVILFRGASAGGDGGRELMRVTLETRGASVLPIACYQRLRPSIDPGAILDHWRQGSIHAVVATSAEVLDNFLDLVGATGKSLLANTPLFVPHPRIAAHAQAAGLTDVVITAATDAGLLAGLLQHFSQRQDTK